MTKLLELKSKFMSLWSEYETWLIPLVKFLLALTVFFLIRKNMGYMAILNRTLLLMILALACSLMPVNAILWIAALLILGNLYALSMMTAAVTLLVFMVIYFIYFRFAPKDGVGAVLTPLSFTMHIPYVMPVGISLMRGPFSFLSVLCGTVIYYLLHGIVSHAGEIAELEADEDSGLTAKINVALGQLVGNKELYLVLAVFAITAIVAGLVRRINTDHAWTLAIISGSLIELVGLFGGYMTLHISGKTFWLLLGTIISIALEFFLEFLFMDLDYSRTERVQFQDDDYVYYVKAVPKKMVAGEERTVLHFGGSGFGKKKDRTGEEGADAVDEDTKAIAQALEIDENLLK